MRGFNLAKLQEIRVPNIGDFADVTVIEVMVSVGSVVKSQDPLITVESEKASVELPSPYSGTVKEIKVKIGDKISEGGIIVLLETSAENAITAIAEELPIEKPVAPTPSATAKSLPFPPSAVAISTNPHASPSIRRFARELGVDLSRVVGSGPNGRIQTEDVQAYVKSALSQPSAAGRGEFNFPRRGAIDFSKFGAIESRPLSRIKKLAGSYLHSNWVSIPHVTQHDEADITELETLRKSMSEDALKQGVKLTVLAFIIKAVVATLKHVPEFNSSLSPNNDALILKNYFHIGIAVDTAEGLVVPVIRDCDKKGILQIAKELADVSVKARSGKLAPQDIQGGCFSISSLGGIGGSFFTPIINAPEVAVLGVSKAKLQPVFIDNTLVPRLLLPLSLSYDHRVVDGAAGARFITHLGSVLGNILQLVL